MAADNTTDRGCCAGTAIDTPAAKFNRPGLPALAYRVGRHPDFRGTLLARLSSTDFPALAALTTRSDDDYTIALCDAFATMADVLTFYQERIANESYLRTATERRSVLELARLIGYQLAPGVAAGTALAFTLDEAPGAPALAAQPVTIPVGTCVQSLPDPGQAAQNFETSIEIIARVEWSAMTVQQSEAVTLEAGLTEFHLAGVNTQVKPGDAILILGTARQPITNKVEWDVRRVDTVELDIERNRTHVTCLARLGSNWPINLVSATGARVFVFRQSAALFGNNAPDASLLRNDNNKLLFDSSAGGPPYQWRLFAIDPNNTAKPSIDLDATYPTLAIGSWLVLCANGYMQLSQVKQLSQLSRSDFGIGAKITRVDLDPKPDSAKFGLRETLVLAQSEELTLAQRPLTHPVYGSALVLSPRQPDLAPGQLIAVGGKRQRVVIGADTTNVTFPDSPTPRTPQPGETFIMSAPPEQYGRALASEELDPAAGLTGALIWHLEDRDGAIIKIEAPAGRLSLLSAAVDDATISEVCAIDKGAGAAVSELDRTTLKLRAPLAHCYDRATVAINANVAPATHGTTVSEIAGSGDASRPNQSFQLMQSPLTYVSTTDASGHAATLQVRVNDLLWREVPTLYGRSRRERVYALRQNDDGKTTVQFGDGVEGARLARGENNVRLRYRGGIGRDGNNLRAGQLSMLLTRPLGVTSAVNPSASSGGQDPENLASARQNAPLRVLTLDRAVSAQDYIDFSRAFSGVAKAYGIWIGDGRARGVHLTVAGPDGAEIPSGSDTLRNLIAALRRYGDRLLPLSVQSYVPATFQLNATVKTADDADPAKVLAAVEGALRAAYSFDARDFGQPLTIDAVYATIQNVPGVIAADINQLHRSDTGPLPPEPQPRLLAALPTVQPNGSVSAAELLVLSPAPIDLGVTA